jgi:catechol 2,3-dioxygenase-like lactoylglutathione lyase family enzyme
MNFTSVRLITANFERLATFYETVSGQPIVRATPSFGELRTAGGTVAIGDTSTLAPLAANGWRAPPPTARLSSSFGWPM